MDDLVPNQAGTDYFDVPEDRQEEESAVAKQLQSANAFLLDVDKWWTEQITMSDHIVHIDPTLPISVEAQYYALTLLHDKLIEKQNEWTEFAETLRDRV